MFICQQIFYLLHLIENNGYYRNYKQKHKAKMALAVGQ